MATPKTYEEFIQGDWKKYVDQYGVGEGGKVTAEHEGRRAWEKFQAANPPTPVGATDAGEATQVVPGAATEEGQMNITDYAGQAATDPSKVASDEMTLADDVPEITEEQKKAAEVADTALEGADAGDLAQDAAQAETATAEQVDPREAETYEAAKTQEEVEQAQMDAAQGEVSEEAQINAEDFVIDTDAVARGETETGKALLDYAELDISDIPMEATMRGQLELLEGEFQDENGEPKIPSWAAAQSRAVSKIAAFKGMTGTAATAAMSTALMEASISVAQQDAQFFQTVTLENLSNEQAATINRANVLAQMDLANMDARMAAAVQNSKNFMDMDLANLNNEQQARAINTQARVQSILEDAKAENTARMFEAESQNEMNKFYDNLNASIDQFNTSQTNSMNQFNTSEENGMKKFNAELENNRDQFYRQMQYNIDVANAKWRQTVTIQDNQNKFEAAALDVKNMVGISQEALNQIWDRSDALLDYIWKSSENQLDRDAAMAQQKIGINAQSDAATKEGIGQVVGAVAGQLVSQLDFF